MRTSFHRPVSATIALALFGAAAVAVAGGPSIIAARSAPEGTAVTVEGVVSVPSGSYDPNDQGFAIQSGNVGIYVHDSLGQGLELGQTVSVSGAVGNSFGQIYGVFPTSIEVTGTHPVHPAEKTDSGDVNEATEGRLVKVHGTVTDAVFDDAPYGWRFHVDDGSGELTVFVYTGTGIDVGCIDEGDELEITGFSGQFIDHYELNPRFQSDIQTR